MEVKERFDLDEQQPDRAIRYTNPWRGTIELWKVDGIPDPPPDHVTVTVRFDT
jgi:hypothetical protein